MASCPACKRRIMPGDTIIGRWHAGCAPAEVRETWDMGMARGFERARAQFMPVLERLQSENEDLKLRQREAAKRIATVEELLGTVAR